MDLEDPAYLGPRDAVDYVTRRLLAKQEPERRRLPRPAGGRLGIAQAVAEGRGGVLIARIVSQNWLTRRRRLICVSRAGRSAPRGGRRA